MLRAFATLKLGSAPPVYLPRPIPLSGVRSLHATASVSVKRPQQPFEVRESTNIDAWGSSTRSRAMNREETARLQLLQRQAEHGGRIGATLSKYSPVFGLRQPGDDGSYERQAAARADRFRQAPAAGGSFGLKRAGGTPRGRMEERREVEAANTRAWLKNGEEGQPKVAASVQAALTHDPEIHAKALKAHDMKTIVDAWRKGLEPTHSSKRTLMSIKREEEAKAQQDRAERRQKSLAKKRMYAEAKRERHYQAYKMANKAGLRGPKAWAAVKQGEYRMDKYGQPFDLKNFKLARDMGSTNGSSTQATNDDSRRWEPTKKLTHAAMAGLRELHKQDPETWTKSALSEKFGVSYEAVGRMLRSSWRDEPEPRDVDVDMGKWSRSDGGVNSPVPHIRAVYGLKRADEAEQAKQATRGVQQEGSGKWEPRERK